MSDFLKGFLTFAVILGIGYGVWRFLPKTNTACFKEQCYLLELAVTPEEKIRGLQKRDHLEKDEGMLFFMNNQTVQKFWMREMLIPIDMLWLDDLGKILYVEHAVVPCESDPCPIYGPDFPSAYVLEVSAGEAARLGMDLGKQVILELRNVK